MQADSGKRKRGEDGSDDEDERRPGKMKDAEDESDAGVEDEAEDADVEEEADDEDETSSIDSTASTVIVTSSFERNLNDAWHLELMADHRRAQMRRHVALLQLRDISRYLEERDEIQGE